MRISYEYTKKETKTKYECGTNKQNKQKKYGITASVLGFLFRKRSPTLPSYPLFRTWRAVIGIRGKS